MNNNTVYYSDGVARVLKLMKDTFNPSGIFKAFYNGEPEYIPEANLPAIVVSETTGRIESGPTGTDVVTEKVIISLIMNKKDEVGSGDDDLTELKLRRLVKGQHPEGHEKAGQYVEQSVMYALRTFITFDEAVVDSLIETDFSVAQRGEDVFTQEAYISVTIQRMAMVPMRS